MGQIRTSTRLWNRQVLTSQSGAKKKASQRDVTKIKDARTVNITPNLTECNANPISNTE
jgi:hypothetical protein